MEVNGQTTQAYLLDFNSLRLQNSTYNKSLHFDLYMYICSIYYFIKFKTQKHLITQETQSPGLFIDVQVPVIKHIHPPRISNLIALLTVYCLPSHLQLSIVASLKAVIWMHPMVYVMFIGHFFNLYCVTQHNNERGIVMCSWNAYYMNIGI